ncbi:DUF6778 family protein [Pseudosulfitobacter koreensis]|uniref:Lipoprotein n=1 Tax=Pseudosulfitobacter koreensis TaxID=2968472 RepID=A0ABT1YXD9_9RHOB|nr:DUF6778 family protein [Pseudosulfitobacter koreense]MCR8825548.1 hypothetical protein [Pseudosulfitobacter koreense]
MKLIKLITVLGLGAMVSACATTETATRNIPFETAPAFARADAMPLLQTDPAPLAPTVRIAAINVTVPQSLKVSEANMYYPSGDIVWREDPAGDRHAQVTAIFQTALQRGADKVAGDRPVVLDVTVTRFHALTEKARYTVGGVHSIAFTMQVRDAATGAPLGAPHPVKANLKAFGGQQAIDAESRGLTQKVRIAAHLAEVLRQEMARVSAPDAPRQGFMQVARKL